MIMAAIGEIIKFGKYDWRVLDVQDGRALLLSEKLIGENRDYDGSTWEKSGSLRKFYLNRIFLESFTDEEKGRITETKVINPGNLWFNTPGGNDTLDKVFLLSLEEVDRYFGNSGDYLGKRRKAFDREKGKYFVNKQKPGNYVSNAHDKDRVACNEAGEPAPWWLRSPGDHYEHSGDNMYIVYPAYVKEDGAIDASNYFNDGKKYGIRPALWLNL